MIINQVESHAAVVMAAAAATTKETSELWHRRIGHYGGHVSPSTGLQAAAGAETIL